MNIKDLVESKEFKPNSLRDQFFLIDENVIENLVKAGEVKREDTVLEIGAGFGNITTEIARSAKKVIAFEIDRRFKKYLFGLPKNVDLRFEDAWQYVKVLGKNKKKKEFNKIISSLPYSFCEKLLHILISLEYKKVILVVPLKFVNTINENGIFSSFFNAELIEIVNKNSFYPVPKTNSAIINLVNLEDPIKTKNLAIFLRQFVYQHEKQKVKNSLMEGLIVFAKLVYDRKLTKNQARGIIEKANLDNEYLNELPKKVEVYNEIGFKFTPDKILVV